MTVMIVAALVDGDSDGGDSVRDGDNDGAGDGDSVSLVYDGRRFVDDGDSDGRICSSVSLLW